MLWYRIVIHLLYLWQPLYGDSGTEEEATEFKDMHKVNLEPLAPVLPFRWTFLQPRTCSLQHVAMTFDPSVLCGFTLLVHI